MAAQRPLSSSERAVWLLDQAAPLNGVIVARVRGPLAELHVRAGLEWLQRRHPLLRVRVDGGARPRFVDDDPRPVPLRVLASTGPDAWRAVAEEEVNAPFSPAARPLMRAVLVQGDGEAHLLLAHHHVVSDGLSAAYQVEELLEIAAALAEGLAPPDPEPLPLRLPMQEVLPAEFRGIRRLGALNRFVLRQVKAGVFHPPRKLRYDSRPPPGERRTRIVHGALSVEETTALVARCRAEKTSVQGALSAALLLAATEGAPVGDQASFGCFSTVNLRPRLAEAVGREMGLYVSQASTFHDLGGRALWELAREVKAELAQAMDRNEPLVSFPLLGLLIPHGQSPVQKFARQVDLASPATMGVTNLGVLSTAERFGPLSLESIQFVIGIALVVPLALAADTFRGALTFNLLHVDPLVSPARAARIAARLRAHLRV